MPEPIIETLIEDLESQPNHELEQTTNDSNGNLIEKKIIEKVDNVIIREIVSKYIQAVRLIVDKNGDIQELPPPGSQIVILIQGGA